MRYIQTLAFFLLFQTLILAQNSNKEIHIKKTDIAIKLDGILNDLAWKNTDSSGDFYLTRPYDSSYAVHQTSVRLSFDSKFIYVGAVIKQPRKNYTISSFKRDFEGGSSDVFTINIDTFKDKINGLQFGVNPYNVQREGNIAEGDKSDNSWDNKWFSAVKNYEDYWVVEMAIPFTTLRYKVGEGTNTWRVNFGRNYMKGNEISTWSPVPRNFKPSNLAFTGLLIWDQNPPKPGSNISLIPYLSFSNTKEFQRNENLDPINTVRDSKPGAGMDAKIAVTPSLNLDLTINPDFSQVEVDAQQTNLSRFELFYPEKRQFFIENSDLFGAFGFPDSRPFFSRRIGLTRNQVTGLNQQVPILAGARLSGKLNDKWRIGLLNMQTQKVKFSEEKSLAASNYSVGVLQRRVLARSYLSGIFVNKENANSTASAFNRVGGLEFNYYSKDNKWEAESYYHQSISPINLKDQSSMAQYIGYHHPSADVNLGVLRIGENFKSEMGFVPRIGVYKVYRPATFTHFIKNPSISKKINTIGIATDGEDVYTLKGTRLDTELSFSIFAGTPSGGEYAVGIYRGYTNLLFSFDPTNAYENPDPDKSANVVDLPTGIYRFSSAWIEFETPRRHKVYGETFAYTGTYFNGTSTNIESSISYRWQPYGVFSLDYNFNSITLPKPYNSSKYMLLGPKAEMALNKSMFWSTYFQYNTQTNNTNINSRLQWRYKPVSDLFIVYTDNYFAQEISRYRVNAWAPKNRAVVLKLTYWLNV